jgi:hypothetical protein
VSLKPSLTGIVGSSPTGDMDVCFECNALSGRGLCVGLISRPEESNAFSGSEYDRENSIMRKPWPTRGC